MVNIITYKEVFLWMLWILMKKLMILGIIKNDT